MIAEVRGMNFHGSYRLRLRVPSEGGELMPGQVRKVRQTLCPYKYCCCGAFPRDDLHGELDWSSWRVFVSGDRAWAIPPVTGLGSSESREEVERRVEALGGEPHGMIV